MSKCKVPDCGYDSMGLPYCKIHRLQIIRKIKNKMDDEVPPFWKRQNV